MSISHGPCRDFLAEFSSFVDGKLDPDRRAVLLAHLDCCEACLRHLKAYRQGIAAYREANAPVPAWGLYERVVERLGESVRPPRDDLGADREIAPRRSRAALGVALAMAVLAMLFLLPPASLDFRDAARRTGAPSSDEEAVTSWASVIPTALPLMAPAEVERAVIAPSSRNPTRMRLVVDELPEVPRREVRVMRVNDVGTGMRPSGFGGWPPRRPPVIVQRASSVMPAAWVAEAALRIP